jgi:BTB/POZ domain-containing protein KCTD9
VNEKQWLSGDRTMAMLGHARHRIPQRQILLFAAACVGRLRPSREAETFATLAEHTRRFADGQGSYEAVEKSLASLRRMRTVSARAAAAYVHWAFAYPGWDPADTPATFPTDPEVAELLRCVAGNPFRAVTVDPGWVTANGRAAERLGRRIRDEDDFTAIPVLADALEEVGCTDRAVLAHCRSGGEHAHGCWVVELLLDRPEPRRSLEETWTHLERQGRKMPRTAKGEPFVQPRMPRPRDEGPLGFHYYKHHVEDADLANLTLPRTFFGRSGLHGVRYRNTDLSRSWMCWNDFIDCDFSGANLSGCQMRSSIFRRCKFVGTNLKRADLRGSTIEGCDFTHALLNGARADEFYAGEFELYQRLSEKQRKVMQWSEEPGPEPDGG